MLDCSVVNFFMPGTTYFNISFTVQFWAGAGKSEVARIWGGSRSGSGAAAILH